MSGKSRTRAGVLIAAVAAIAVTALAVPSSAAAPTELATHRPAQSHAAGRVVYHFDRAHYAGNRRAPGSSAGPSS